MVRKKTRQKRYCTPRSPATQTASRGSGKRKPSHRLEMYCFVNRLITECLAMLKMLDPVPPPFLQGYHR